MKTISIHQPGYLPWLGYFEKIARADVHVFLDDVQFEKNSFDNRNRIRNSQGWLWLTVPVLTKGRFGENILKEVEIDNHSRWAQKHWKSILMNYGKTPYFRAHADFFEQVYSKPWTKLLDLNLEIISYLLKTFHIETPLVYSSQIQKTGKKSDLVLGLCKQFKADVYLSGALGKDYLDMESFRKEDIRVIFQDYAHPLYRQPFSEFISHLSALDLVFNEGRRSLEILLQGNPKTEQAAS